MGRIAFSRNNILKEKKNDNCWTANSHVNKGAERLRGITSSEISNRVYSSKARKCCRAEMNREHSPAISDMGRGK